MEYATRCTLKDLLEKRERPLKEEVIIKIDIINKTRLSKFLVLGFFNCINCEKFSEKCIEYFFLGCTILVLASYFGSTSYPFKQNSSSRLKTRKYHVDWKSWRYR